MSADCELLELAARAAGVALVDGVYDELLGCTTLDGEGYWHPLDDDGQALRLAVELGFEVYHGGGASFVGYWMGGRPLYCIENHDNTVHKGDACSATRRAIVRAAAEIGKSAAATALGDGEGAR